MTCTDPTLNKDKCSCTCTNDLVFELPLPPHGQSRPGSCPSSDDCQEAKDECLKRELELTTDIATQQGLLKREQDSTADLQKQLELLKQEPDFMTKLTELRKKPYVDTGCYRYIGNEIRFERGQSFQHATNGACQQYCDTFQSYGYKYGYLCFCGLSWPNGPIKVNDSECKIKCTGNDGQTCGGKTAIHVFKREA